MFSMVMDSVKLFVTGRLFANYTQVFLRGILATLLGAVILVGLGQFVSVVIAAVVGGAVSGFTLPILDKDLKYR